MAAEEMGPKRAGGVLGLLAQPETELTPERDPRDDALTAASDSVFDAVQAGDRTAFREALERFIRMSSLSGGEEV